MTATPSDLVALVLAGGDGTRLQDFTARLTGVAMPKQYCRIVGERSLLEGTLARLAPLVPPGRTFAIVNAAHLPLARPQLRALPSAHVIVQPQNRDTGPGLALSLLAIAARTPEATVAIFPSDHWIRDGVALRRAVARLTMLVARRPERIGLLGIRPDRPDPSLGYVVPGVAFGDGTWTVARFHEKPSPLVASQLIGGGALWNSFVMVGRVGRLLDLVRARRPDEIARLAEALGDRRRLAAAYAHMTPWNFSHDVLTRVSETLVVSAAADLGWSDWGTPEAIARTVQAEGLRLVPSASARQRVSA